MARCREDGGDQKNLVGLEKVFAGVVGSLDDFEKRTGTGEVTGFGCKVGNEGRGKAEAQRSDNTRRDAWVGDQ